MHRASIIIASILLGGAVNADTVTLVNGNTLEGRVRYENGKIVVEMAGGTVVLDKSKVAEVEEKRTAIHEYHDKFAALKAKKDDATAAEYAALAQFAEDNGLKRFVTDHYRKALSLDPNNEAARKGLGYIKQDGVWMTADEAARARGLVQHNGQWVTPEAKADIEKLRAAADLEKAKAETERLKLERLDRELDAAEAARERDRARFEEQQYWDRYLSSAVIVSYNRGNRCSTYVPPVVNTGSGVTGVPSGRGPASPGYFGFHSTLNTSPNASSAYLNRR